MPKVNWPDVRDADNFSPAPPGTYRVKVAKVDVGKSQSLDEMWTIELTIVAGDYKGKKIIDRLTFSPQGLPRVKIAAKAFGIDVSKESNFNPVDILTHHCNVDVTVEDYVSRKPGQEAKTYQNNKVAFAGYHALGSVSNAEEADDDLPF